MQKHVLHPQRKSFNSTYSRMTNCLCISASCQSNQAPSWTIIWCHRGGFKSNRISGPPETDESFCVCLTKRNGEAQGKEVLDNVALSPDWKQTHCFPSGGNSFTSRIIFMAFAFVFPNSFFIPLTVFVTLIRRVKRADSRALQGLWWQCLPCPFYSSISYEWAHNWRTNHSLTSMHTPTQRSTYSWFTQHK